MARERRGTRTRLLALEPRVLFDGALAEAAIATTLLQGAADRAPASDPLIDALAQASAAAPADARSGMDAQATAPAATQPHEVVFVDTTVADYRELLAAIANPDARVILLDPSRDAIEQMASAMDGMSGVSAVHVISHGTAGELILGGQAYSADRLATDYQSQLARIGRGLSADGDILMYGCEIGQGSAGESFVRQVAQQTGADVAASNDKTGAASLGGNWTLETQAGLVDAQAVIDVERAAGYDHLLATVDVNGLLLNFTGATLQSGTALSVGAVYKFTNVATVSGVQVDAYITIDSMVNASLNSMDNAGPGGYNAGSSGVGAGQLWAPVISTTAVNGRVNFSVSFRDTSSNPHTLLNLKANAISVDSVSAGVDEFVEAGGYQSFTRSAGGTATTLGASLGPGDRVRVFQGSGTQLAGLVVEDSARVQFNFGPVSTIQLSMGVGGVVSNRQMAIAFTPIAFASGSVDIAAPTVNALSTSDTTPLLTGTIGAASIGSDTFSVTVNGTTYTTASGVNIVGGNWSLTVPTALTPGTYDVRAIRNAGGLPIVDQTTTELTITPVNNAPVLDAGVSPVFNTTEDAGVPSGAVGSLVSTLTAGVSDADTSALKGVAVTGADTTNGTWYYSTNGGTNWNALGAVSSASARLLADDGNTRLYFAPNANYNGTSTAAITFRAWDQTTGANGGTADTSGANSGGTTAFSTATDTANVVVAAVNDAPVATIPATYSAIEQNTLNFQGTMSIADVDAGGALVQVTLSVNSSGVLFATAGTTGVTVTGHGTSTVTLEGTVAQINTLMAGPGGSFSYVSPTDNPPASETLTVTVRDLGNTGSGGPLEHTVTATINITPLNDPPVFDLDTGSSGLDAAVTFTEQTPVRVAPNPVMAEPDSTTLAWLTATLAARPDGNAVESLSLNASGTTLAAANGLTVTYTAATGVLSISGSASRPTYLNLIGSIVYNNTSDTPSTSNRSVALVLNDGVDSSATRTSTIAVVPVNDAPVADLNGAGAGNDNTASFTEQTPVLIAPSATLADVDSATMASMTVTLTARPNGALESLSLNPAASAAAAGLTVNYNSATGALSITGSASRATYETILQGIQYDNTSDAPDTTNRSITVVVNDGGANSVTRTVTVGVTAVNDAPLATMPGPYATTEQTPLALQGTGMSISDPDAGAGAVRATLQVLNGSTLTINAGSTGVTVTGSGTRTVTLDGTVAAINDLLAGNGGATISHIRNSDTATVDVLQLSVTDLGNTGTGGPLTSSASLPITITTVNDAPTLGGPAATLTYTENGPAAAIDTGLTVADPDLGSFGGGFVEAAFTAGGTLADQLTVLNQGNGAGQIGVSGSTVSYGGVAIGTIDGVFNGANGAALRITLNGSATAAAAEALACAIAFSNSSDAPSTAARTVTFTLDDGGNGGGAALQGTRTATVNVNAVNDAPVVSSFFPGYGFVEGMNGTLQGTGLAIADVDAGNAPVRATLNVGSPSTIAVFAGTTGVTVTGSGTDSVTLDGTVAQINALLAGNLGATITYVGRIGGVSGPVYVDTMTLAVDDLGNSGSGGPQTHSLAIPMSIPAVNDAPVNTVPAAQSVNEDTPLVFSTANGNAVSIADTDADTLQVQISVTNGILTLAGTAGLTFDAGANGSSTMTVTGNKAAINAALNGLSYTPTAGYNGPATLTLVTGDLGASGVGGAQTDTDTVTITVNAVNNAPVVDLNGGAAGNDTSASFTEQTPVLIAPSATLADIDSANLNSLTVTLTARPNGALESLSLNPAAATAASGLTVNYDSATGVLSITGSASTATYQSILQGIQYNNTSDAPDTTSRSISVVVNDGSGNSITRTVAVDVTAVNDAPVASIYTSGYSVWENSGAVTFPRLDLYIADVDAGNAPVRATLSAVRGTFDVSLGTTGVTVTGSGTTSITLEGTVAQINDLLTGNFGGDIRYTPRIAGVYTGASVTDPITFTVDDLGNSGSGGAQTASTSTTMWIFAVNDPPVNTVPVAQSTGEDTPLVFSTANGNALSVDDVDALTLQVQISVTNGVLTLASTTGLTFNTGANGSSTMTVTGNKADINAALNGLTYTPGANYAGPVTLTLFTSDLGSNGSGGIQSDADTVTITVNGANDAPVAAGGNTSVTATEDTALSGSLPAAVDPDGDPFTYAKASDPANGTVVVNPDGTYTYTPAANYFGPDSFTYTVSDGTASNTYTVSITVNPVNDAPVADLNGAGAGNDNSASFTEQTPVLIAPSATLADVDSATMASMTVTLTARPNGAMESLSLNGAASAAAAGLTVSYNAGTGVLSITGSASRATYQAILQGIQYNNTSDTPDTTNRSITVAVNDGSANSVTQTVTVNVTAVNDAPVANILAWPGHFVTEGVRTQLFATAGAAIVDVDAGSGPVRVTLSVGSGTIEVFAGTTGVTVTNSGTSSVTLEGTVAQINSLIEANLGATIHYTGEITGVYTGVNFMDTLTLTVDDLGNSGSGGAQTDGSVTQIYVWAVNDPPVNTVPVAQSTTEDTPVVFSTANGNAISVADVDALTLRVQISVTNGFLTLASTTGLTFNAGANGSSTMTVTGSKADINAALNGLTYTPTANYNGPATLTVFTSDLGSNGDGGPQTDTDTVTITVNGANDAPVAAGGNTSVTATEDTVLSGNLPTAVDPDGDPFTYAKASDPANGTVVVNPDGTYTYTPAANYFGPDSFTYTVSDGTASNTYTVSITVNPVNDAPVVDLNGAGADNDNSASFTEQTPVLIAPSATLADIDSANLASMTVTLTARPNGAMESLSLNGAASAAAAGLTVSYDSGTGILSITGSASRSTYQTILQGIQYNNTSDTPDTTNRSITVAVNDGGENSATQTVTVGVTAVNDAPVVTTTIAAATFAENAPWWSLSSASFSIADVDAGSSLVRATLSAASTTFDVTVGTTGVTVTGSGTNNVILEGTVAQINNLIAGNFGGRINYTGHVTNYTGASVADSFTLTVDDLGNSGSGGAQTGSASYGVTIMAVNDAPVNGVPAAQSTNEDTPLVFSPANGNAISVADVDALTLQVQISVTNGVLTLASTTGLTFNAGANGSSTMTVTGNKADINAALNGLSYTPTTNYNGPATLTVFTSDLGASGSGGTLTDTDTVTITVNAVNDAPTATITPPSFTVNEQTTLALQGVMSVGDIDAGSAPIRVTLQVTTGLLYATAGTTGVTVSGFGTNLLTLDGTLAQINDLLSGGSGSAMNYYHSSDTPPPTDTLTLTVSDLGNTGAGGAQTASTSRVINITPINDVPLVDLDTGSASADATASFTEQIPVRLAPSILLYDPDSTNMVSLTATLAARPDGNAVESLSLGAAASAAAASNGLTVSYDASTGVLSITGSASRTVYGTLLRGIFYNNTSDTPSTVDRSVTVVVNDGAADSIARTVTVTVTAVNDAPAGSNTSITVTEDTPASGSLPVAVDPEGDPVTYTKASDPANGTVVVNADGTYTYTPGLNYAGADSFTYTVSDGNGGSNTYTVNVTVTAVNDAPTAGNIAITTGDGTPASGSLPVAVDPDADPVTYAKGSDPANGAVVVNADGTYTYTPNPSYLGPDSFTYTVSDGNGGSNTYTVSITVVDLTPPVLPNQSFTYLENRGTGEVLGNVAASDNSGAVTGFRFVDSSGNPLGATSQDGYFTVDGVGRITLTPAGAAAGAAPNDFEIGTHTFSYSVQARDGAGNWSAAGTVTLTVADVDDIAPQINPGQSFQLPAGTGTQVGQVSATDNVGVTDFRFTGTGTNVSGDGFFTISNTGVISLTPAGAAASAMDRDFWTSRSALGEAVQARDSAGNWSSSVVVNFQVADVAPATDDEDERVAELVVPDAVAGGGPASPEEFGGLGGAAGAGGTGEGLVLPSPPSADAVASAGARGWPLAGESMLFGGPAHERPMPSRLVNLAAQAWAAQSRSIDRLPETDDRSTRHDRVEPAELGFVLLRLAVRDLGSPGMVRRDMLVRYRRVPDPAFPAGSGFRFVLPKDAFAHTNPSAVVRLHATLAADKPLPHWLKFDGDVGVLHGKPPGDFRGVLQIHITARDNQGLQASTRFSIAVGEPGAVEMTPEPLPQAQAPAVRWQAKEEAPAGEGGAARFADQLRGVRARGAARMDDDLLWALRSGQAESPWGAEHLQRENRSLAAP